MKPLVIFGAGDIARLAYWYFSHDTNMKVVAFCVDRGYLQEETFLSLPLVAFDEILQKYPPDSFDMFVAMSYAENNRNREKAYLRARECGYTLVSYVSSKCTYLSDDPPGDNCFILENNTIQPFTKIGNNVTMWSGNHLGHDSIIDDHVFIASHVVISGHVHIGRNCFLGVNATTRNGITIAPYSIIGASALIMRSTKEGQVYIGERTKPI
ncbi:MAG: acetyltransferase, partial [Bacteroidales bacterium]|nr:acetyltransferase [Bacteroidales bacterium]